MSTTEQLRHPERISGYTYGAGEAARSPLTLADLDRLKAAVDLTEEDERWLHTAGDVLADQADEMVATWRKILKLRIGQNGFGRPVPRTITPQSTSPEACH